MMWQWIAVFAKDKAEKAKPRVGKASERVKCCDFVCMYMWMGGVVGGRGDVPGYFPLVVAVILTMPGELPSQYINKKINHWGNYLVYNAQQTNHCRGITWLIP